MRLHRLADGTPLILRPIAPDDAWQLQRALGLLSAETIQRRFLGPKPRFSAAELRYLTEVDGHDHLALVAADAHSGWIRAVARCVRLPEDPRTAEWAVVVCDDLQRRGIGTALVRALADDALGVGITRFTGTVAGENRAVLRLLQHVTDRFLAGSISRGTREVLVELEPLSA